uniref:Uncharacterized protein n=1 Tax=Arundo donax TaxID=35708 RepID=A0A0A9BQR5_ARUDO
MRLVGHGTQSRGKIIFFNILAGVS